jgi:amino acid transporter
VLQHRRDVAGPAAHRGAYSFARSAMGPWGGFITGLAENMEYVITVTQVISVCL